MISPATRAVEQLSVHDLPTRQEQAHGVTLAAADDVELAPPLVSATMYQ